MTSKYSVYSNSALLLTLGSALTLSSCGKVNDMHDATMEMRENMNKTVKTTEGMAKTTEGMAVTTNGMAKTTEDMGKTTHRMEDTTCKMYTSLRQGNSKVSRDTDMEAIRNGKNITEKLELAAKYMQGFEYQIWTPSCSDVAPREIVIEQAATEILTGIQPYVKNRAKVSSTKQSDRYETLYALAATLHRTNSLQEGFLAGTEEQAMRPLDIIVQGLRLNQQKNNGELGTVKFPSWANIVGKYEKDAEFLLRLRANFMMAYGYAIADSDAFGNAPKLIGKVFRIGKAKLFKKSKWKPKLEKRDATEIRERITVALKLSAETRKNMIDLGIDPMTDETMLKVWKQADFSGYNLDSMSKKGGKDAARAIAIKDLIEARDLLLKI